MVEELEPADHKPTVRGSLPELPQNVHLNRKAMEHELVHNPHVGTFVHNSHRFADEHTFTLHRQLGHNAYVGTRIHSGQDMVIPPETLTSTLPSASTSREAGLRHNPYIGTVHHGDRTEPAANKTAHNPYVGTQMHGAQLHMHKAQQPVVPLGNTARLRDLWQSPLSKTAR